MGKRLEFINGELDRLDSRLKALEKQAAERQQKVLSMVQMQCRRHNIVGPHAPKHSTGECYLECGVE